jgi:histidyl-tRNA synthetase
MRSDDRARNIKLAQPRGFHDRSGIDVDLEDRAVSLFARRAALIGCRPLKTAPLGFRQLYEHARGDFSGKTYLFEDRSRREVMLCPDSTSAIIRWYAERKLFEPERVFFRSPVFRYRRQPNRHFTQIGIAFFNEPSNAANVENESVLLLARSAIRLFTEDFGIQVRLKVTDLGVWHKALMQAGFDPQQRLTVLSKLRNVEVSQRLEALNQFLDGRTMPATLLHLASLDEETLRTASSVGDDLTSHAQRFGQSVVSGLNCSFTLAFDDLHASELQDGISFSLIDNNGDRCCDGGCYSHYANQFDARLTSLQSLATSIEYLVRTAPVELRHPDALLIVTMGNDIAGARSIEESCQSSGIPVIRRPLVGRLRDVLRKIEGPRWLIVYGTEEADSGQVRLRDLAKHRESVLFSHEVAGWLQAVACERRVSCT